MLLASSRFPIHHGFSTRAGGVSEGPFASLNLGRSVGDDPERVEENARRFARAADLAVGQFVSVNQVHGDRILEVDAAASGAHLAAALGDADGLVTRARGAALSIRTADCVPVLLYAPDAGAVGAVHAGWRGSLAAIARRGVERLVDRFGARPGELFAVIGPSIRRCCYEVDEGLAAQFRARFGAAAVARGDRARPHLDLVASNRAALLEAGVAPENIDVLPHCTCCDGERFFSHRRDRGRSGRHLAFAVL